MLGRQTRTMGKMALNILVKQRKDRNANGGELLILGTCPTECSTKLTGLRHNLGHQEKKGNGSLDEGKAFRDWLAKKSPFHPRKRISGRIERGASLSCNLKHLDMHLPVNATTSSDVWEGSNGQTDSVPLSDTDTIVFVS